LAVRTGAFLVRISSIQTGPCREINSGLIGRGASNWREILAGKIPAIQNPEHRGDGKRDQSDWLHVRVS